jgi:hypothetical protein
MRYKQHNHDQSTMELRDQHQHDKSDLCRRTAVCSPINHVTSVSDLDREALG